MPQAYTPTGRTARGRTGIVYHEWAVENSHGAQSPGLGGFDWGALIGAGSQAFTAWFAASQMPHPPSLQEQLDNIWFQIRDTYQGLIAQAQANPATAAQALQIGAQLAQQWAQARGQFASLNTPQSGYQVDGVTNNINVWMAKLAALAGGGSAATTNPTTPATTGGGSIGLGGMNIPVWALAAVAGIFLLKR